MSATAQSREPESVEQLESRIVEVRPRRVGAGAGPPSSLPSCVCALGGSVSCRDPDACAPVTGLGPARGGPTPRCAGPGARAFLLCSRRT